MKKLLTKKEAAEYLECSVTQIDRYRRSGVLPYVKMSPHSNSKVLFDIADIQDFIAARKYNSGLRNHGEGFHYGSGFRPGGELVSGSNKPDDYEGEETQSNYDMPPDIY